VVGIPALGLSLLGLLFILALILANAYFVATEFALVAVRRTQVKLWVQEGRSGSRSVERALENLDDAIAATQLGITFASIALGFIGEPILAEMIRPGLAVFGVASEAAVRTIAVGVAFGILTFLHVVVGELAPKALALDRPGPVALACARPLLVFGRVFRPLLVTMNGAGNALVHALGVRSAAEHRSVHSPAELSMLVSEAREAGALQPETGRILGNVFRITRRRVRDVMVPRDKVVAVERRTDVETLFELVRDAGFTRLPVYDRELDRVVGILHSKDLFYLMQQRGIILMDAIRPPTFMEPDVTVADALRQFRRGRSHLAVVREGEGPVLGVCTLEDILEEIVGAIEDEHDIPTAAGTAES
jgi:CBS domain containing-hemolysin-like protein